MDTQVKPQIQRLPEGPAKAPLLVRQYRTLRWIFNPLEVLDRRAKQFGDSFRVSPPDSQPAFIYFSSPEALEAIFTAKPGQLSAGRANALLEPLLGSQGIVLLDGKEHQRHRQLLMPPFHGDRMKSYGQTMIDIARQEMSQLEMGKPFAVRPAMQQISLRVILATVFGLEGGERTEQLRQQLSTMLEGFANALGFMFLFYTSLQKDWGAWSPWGRFVRQRSLIDETLYAEIRDRRAAGVSNRNDILALLMSARDEAGEPMTDKELRDELLTLLFAGHETTASSLAWALYWVAKLPDVRSRLLAEIDALGKHADPMAIAKLPYLTAVCQETLRIYPITVTAFPRVVKQPFQILDYELQPGMVVIPAIYLAHHRPSVYPNPKRFDPNRFLERQFSPYEFLPFGGGDRRCIGSAFALFEMKLVLFTLLSNLDLSLPDNRPIKPIRRGVTVAPSPNLRLVSRPR